MLVYIQQKDIQQSRTKINKFLSITTKINKTQSSEPKIKKCKIQTCNMNHFKFLSIIITTKINKKQSQKLKKRKIRNMNHFEFQLTSTILQPTNAISIIFVFFQPMYLKIATIV